MAKKTPAAQLNREIAEALAGSGSSSPFEEAKAKGARLEKEVEAASAALQTFPKGPMGGVGDAVRASPEFQAANTRFQRAFARLRAFNGAFVKKFAKELRAERAQRTRERSHATMAERPTKEKLQQAAKWIRRELSKRSDGSHPSHLAAKVLEEADAKFKLGSFGVEGWAKSPSRGYQYLNYGDPYDSTIVVRANPTKATVFVALGGWASYAGSGT